MLKIGITGGIGSGKTTVCNIFEVLGTAVYYSDFRAKEIMTLNSDLKDKLCSEFSHSIFNREGKLETIILASIVFADNKKLEKLNKIVHPYVIDDFFHWCNDHADKKYVLLESAIIYESKIDHLLDYVIIVDAPVKTRINRIIERDKINEVEILKRMNTQNISGTKISNNQLTIINDGKVSLIDQVMNFHQRFSML